MNDNVKTINPITVMFLIVQLIIIIFVAISLSQVIDGTDARDAQGNYINQPEVEIVGLDMDSFGLTDEDIEYIQKNIFQTVASNTQNISKGIKAEIRPESVKSIYFERKDFHYLTAILDIPEIEQSYRFFYTYPYFGDDIYAIAINDTIFTLCLNDSDGIKYSNFKCNDSQYAPTRTIIAMQLLRDSYFDYFSVSLDSPDSNEIIINPSVTYDNDEATKKSYIEEVKSTIESFGISSDLFTYYVRTAADINYDNPE